MKKCVVWADLHAPGGGHHIDDERVAEEGQQGDQPVEQGHHQHRPGRNLNREA